MKDNLGISDKISFAVTKEKEIIRDGRVAILYSPSHGAGWFTWHGVPELLRDPEVVHLVECREKVAEEDKAYYNEQIMKYCDVTYGTDGKYYGGADQLAIEWIELGDKFRITEYDGAETIEYLTSTLWLEA
jgi:hypothetical protein